MKTKFSILFFSLYLLLSGTLFSQVIVNDQFKR